MHIGVDAKPLTIEYTASGQDKHFRTNVGCVVVVEDYASFKKQYSAVISKLNAKFGFSEKKCYSSWELLALTQGNQTILDEFFEAIKPHIAKLNIVYSSFNTARIPKYLFLVKQAKRVRLI